MIGFLITTRTDLNLKVNAVTTMNTLSQDDQADDLDQASAMTLTESCDLIGSSIYRRVDSHHCDSDCDCVDRHSCCKVQTAEQIQSQER